MRVVIQTAPILVNSFHPTQVYLLFMRLSVWVDLIELVRHKHERSHKSFFTNRGGSAAQADPAHNRSPHNHTHSPLYAMMVMMMLVPTASSIIILAPSLCHLQYPSSII